MMDLILLGRDRIIDFLGRRLRAPTRDIADALGWTIERTLSELETLEQFRKVESRPAFPSGKARGADREWSAID